MHKTIDMNSIISATLLSSEEYAKYWNKIPHVAKSWWLRSPGRDEETAACVFGELGSFIDDGSFVIREFGVRPALQISNQESLKPGDKFNFGENSFTYLGEGLALCDNIVGNCVFRKDWIAPDANVYEESDVKRYVENWLEKQLFLEQNREKVDDIEQDR